MILKSSGQYVGINRRDSTIDRRGTPGAAVGKRTIIIEKTRTWSPIVNGFDAFLPCINEDIPNAGDWEWVFNCARKELKLALN